MTPNRLCDTKRAWFLVTGQNKNAALSAWLRGDELPARHISAESGVDILTDQFPDHAEGASQSTFPSAH